MQTPDRGQLRQLLLQLLKGHLDAFPGERNLDILKSLVVSVNACVAEACTLPDAVTTAPFGDGVGECKPISVFLFCPQNKIGNTSLARMPLENSLRSYHVFAPRFRARFVRCNIADTRVSGYQQYSLTLAELLRTVSDITDGACCRPCACCGSQALC